MLKEYSWITMNIQIDLWIIKRKIEYKGTLIVYSWIIERIFTWIHEYSNENCHCNIHLQIYRCGIEVDLTSTPAHLVAHYLSCEHQILLHPWLQRGWTMTSAAAETSRLGAVVLPRFCQQAAAKLRMTLSEPGVQRRGQSSISDIVD